MQGLTLKPKKQRRLNGDDKLLLFFNFQKLNLIKSEILFAITNSFLHKDESTSKNKLRNCLRC